MYKIYDAINKVWIEVPYLEVQVQGKTRKWTEWHPIENSDKT